MPTDPEIEPTIQARFQVTLPDGTVYTDALVMPRSEFNALTNAQIRNLRQQRVTNYLSAIEAAKNAPKPSRAEVRQARQEQRDALRTQRDALGEQLAQVEAEITADS